jgi:hypothetical protein
MSGVIKSVKKVFKKVVKVVKKIIKPVLVATAIYFTAGLALSAFPATAGFAASMPGFAGGGFLGTGIGAGATAGTGIFSKVAGAIGLGGGLEAGAAGIGGVGGGALPGAVTGGVPSVFNTGAALGDTAGVLGVGGGATAGATTAAASGVATKAAMSLTDKLLLAKLGTDLAGAAFGPTPQEEYEAQAIEAAKFRGGFYGMEADGTVAPQPVAQAAPAGQAPQAQPAQANRGPQPLIPPGNQPSRSAPPMASGVSPGEPLQMGQVPGRTQPAPAQDLAATVTPEQQALLAGREKRELFPRMGEPQSQVGQTVGPGAMQSNLQVPGGLFSSAPNVRYV